MDQFLSLSYCLAFFQRLDVTPPVALTRGGVNNHTRNRGRYGTLLDLVPDHIDRPPLGDLGGLFKTILCIEDKHVQWVIEHRKDRRGYRRDLKRIKKEINREHFNTSYALKDLDRYLKELEDIFNDLD